MLIGIVELKKRIKKRLPMLTKKELNSLFKATIELLIERFVNNQNIIIDNFGVLSRKKSKPRKVVNIATGKHQIIVSNTVCLRPNHTFLAFFRDRKNRKKIKQKILEYSREAFSKNKKSLI